MLYASLIKIRIIELILLLSSILNQFDSSYEAGECFLALKNIMNMQRSQLTYGTLLFHKSTWQPQMKLRWMK